MRETNRTGNQFVEDRGLQLHTEKVGIVGIECGIQVFLDRRQINTIVLHSRVVALHHEGEQSQPHKNRQGFGCGLVFHAWTLIESSGCRIEHSKLWSSDPRLLVTLKAFLALRRGDRQSSPWLCLRFTRWRTLRGSCSAFEAVLIRSESPTNSL